MIKAIKSGKYETNLEELFVKLTPTEKRVLIDMPLGMVNPKIGGIK